MMLSLEKKEKYLTRKD